MQELLVIAQEIPHVVSEWAIENFIALGCVIVAVLYAVWRHGVEQATNRAEMRNGLERLNSGLTSLKDQCDSHEEYIGSVRGRGKR